MAKAAASATSTTTTSVGARQIGPPMLILGLGFASAIASFALVGSDDVPPRVVGYVVGALIPIIVIGLARRIDLDRRRSPSYQASSLFRPGLVALAVVAVVAAAVHVWPIATELAS